MPPMFHDDELYHYDDIFTDLDCAAFPEPSQEEDVSALWETFLPDFPPVPSLEGDCPRTPEAKILGRNEVVRYLRKSCTKMGPPIFMWVWK